MAETTTTAPIKTITLQFLKNKKKRTNKPWKYALQVAWVTYRLWLRVHKDARLLGNPPHWLCPLLTLPMRLSDSRLELGWGRTTFPPHHLSPLSTSRFIRSATCLLVGDKGSECGGEGLPRGGSQDGAPLGGSTGDRAPRGGEWCLSHPLLRDHSRCSRSRRELWGWNILTAQLRNPHSLIISLTKSSLVAFLISTTRWQAVAEDGPQPCPESVWKTWGESSVQWPCHLHPWNC